MSTWAEGRSRLWASTPEGPWIPIELDEELEPTGLLVEINGRLLVPVATRWEFIESERPVTRILSTSDALSWEMSKSEVTGWPSQMGQGGSHVVMILESVGPRDSMPTFTVLRSTDGDEWTELGPLPTFRESWPRLLPDMTTIRIVIESDRHSGLWEWVPPAG